MPRRRSRKERIDRLGNAMSAAEGAAPAKGYKVVSISLYSDQAELLDRATDELLQGGYAKANRSLVVQTAIQRLREDLEGKRAEEIVQYFVEQQVKRPPARVTESSKRVAKISSPSASRRATSGKTR